MYLKKETVIILSVLFLIVPVFAEWKYNPFTDALDYYTNVSVLINESYADETYVSKAGSIMSGDLWIADSNPRLYFNDTDVADGYMYLDSDGNKIGIFGKSGALTWQVIQFVLSGSKVGINFLTGTPNQELEVIGNINATGDYYGGGSLFVGDSIDIDTDITVFSDGSPIMLHGDTPESKPSIGFYSWDQATNQYRGVSWLVSHYNLTNGDIHSHFSIETLDNSSETPTLNSHFEISYNGSQKRANILFPSSDVRFGSEQRCYFGDTKSQAWIVHNGTSGDLELKSNADIQIQGTQLDINYKNIVNVEDMFSKSGSTFDIKAGSDVRLFPDGQTDRNLAISDNGASIDISAQGSSYININDELKLSGVSGSGKVVCIKADGYLGVCSDATAADGTCTCG